MQPTVSTPSGGAPLRRALLGLLLLGGCTRGGETPAPPAVGTAEAEVRRELEVLAADSMEGRMTGSPGAERAARYLAERLRALGVAPAYEAAAGPDSAYFQRLPLAAGGSRGGRPVPRLLPSWSALDTVAPERRLTAANVVGVVRGSDPALRDQAVVVGAHYDHVGIGRPVGGDSIYNGADDDASGVAAVLGAARALARGAPPRRTVVFLLTTGEEVGLLGTSWYLRHPVIPLARTVAELQVEMIGRPDSLAGGRGRAWLTGYERSDVGERLAAAGVPLVADPRPAQRFFQRSDNIAFACLGIPAHTLSSFNLHADYHTPDDEVERVDFAHATRLVEATARAVRLLADGPAVAWKPGGSPVGDNTICGPFQ